MSPDFNSTLGLAAAYIFSVLAGYLLGSVNSAIIFTRIFKDREDIRKQGSGNAGMTNVLRSVGKVPAFLTFVGDFLKCVIACLLAWGIMVWSGAGLMWVQVGRLAAGVACVLGHMFPVFFGFRGGKGIVTSAAMMLMTDWRVFLLILATFGLAFLLKRIISLASVCCAALYPVYTFLVTYFLGGPYGMRYSWFLVLVTAEAVSIGALVIWQHRSNIERLLKGEEKPVTARKRNH